MRQSQNIPTIVRFCCETDGRVTATMECWGDRRNPDRGMQNADSIERLVRIVMRDLTDEERGRVEDILAVAEERERHAMESAVRAAEAVAKQGGNYDKP